MRSGLGCRSDVTLLSASGTAVLCVYRWQVLGPITDPGGAFGSDLLCLEHEPPEDRVF